MADSVKHKSRSKERSRSRTSTIKKKESRLRSRSNSSNNSSTNTMKSSNKCLKRKTTSCSKDKRKKSRRYRSTSSSSSSSSSSTSSSSTSSSSNSTRKKSNKNFKKEIKSMELIKEDFKDKKKKIDDRNQSRSRTRSAKEKNNDYQRPSVHHRKTESYQKGEYRQNWRSEGEKFRTHPRDYRYANNQNNLRLESTEKFIKHGQSRIKNEREASSENHNERRNSISVNNEQEFIDIKAVKKSDDIPGTKNRIKESRDRSVSSSKNKNKAKKSKEKRSSSSSSSSSSNSSSDESKAEKARKKRKKIAIKKLKKAEKKQKKKEKKLKKKLKKSKKKSNSVTKEEKKAPDHIDQSNSSNDRLLHDISMEVIERAKAMAPMTKEQWEKKQSVVRRVYDEETGRHRLIRGGGEIIEEIVSRDRHREINRQATRGDGEYFQSRLRLTK